VKYLIIINELIQKYFIMSEENLDINNQKDSGDEMQYTYLKRKKKNVGKEINKLLQKDLKNQVFSLIIRILFLQKIKDS
jgi:hypothetical protein